MKLVESVEPQLILMSASTVVVAANAQLLRRLDLTPQRVTRSVPAPEHDYAR